jgi:asparagine synthase (glutamine-hydrolysing)
MKSKFNLNINYLKPKFEDLRNDFDDLLRTQSDIFRSLSIYVQYYLFKNIDKNIKVMLSGQGADELFGGYYHHVARYLPNSKEEYKNRLKVYGQQAKKELELGLKFCLDDNNKLNKLKNDNINNLKIVNEVLNSYIPNYNYLIDKFDSSFSSCLIKETTKNNLPMLLRFEDRNAMRFSIENRTPFTDYKVIEFAHSLPNSYKVHNGFSKYFLREFSNKFLPQEISFRVDKKGFEAPEEAWIKKLGFSGNLVDFRLNIYKGLLDA